MPGCPVQNFIFQLRAVRFPTAGCRAPTWKLSGLQLKDKDLSVPKWEMHQAKACFALGITSFFPLFWAND